MSTPQTTIYICSGVRLNSKYEHSIYFANASEQREYFAGKVVKTLPAYSYVRRSWKLKVGATMSEALTWNYLYFRNASSDPSYYYFFINNVEYVNDETVELELELDVIQTYLFRFQLLPCFVEREHTQTDAIGEHVLDEGLDLGEYTNTDETDVKELTRYSLLAMSNYSLLITPTSEPNVDTSGVANITYNAFGGVVNTIPIYGCRLEGKTGYPGTTGYNISTVIADLVDIHKYLAKFDGEGLTDNIVSMWMYPSDLLDFVFEDNTVTPFQVLGGTRTIEKTIPKIMDFDGYTPANNKLYTYPFNFLYATNNMGDAAIYRYEKFSNTDEPKFEIKGSCTPEGGIRLSPLNYNGVAKAYEEGLTLSSFPSCAWNADPYKLWLAQNQHQLEHADAMATLKIAAGVGGAVGSLATGNVVGAVGSLGAVVSGVSDIYGLIAQKKDADAQPIQARGTYSPSANFVNRKHTFTFYNRRIDYEHAKIIDDFFTMFGYKVNTLKYPNINARKAFTYVKTRGCHATGNICNSDIKTIEEIFDRGVTFWKDGDKIGVYGQDNSPI